MPIIASLAAPTPDDSWPIGPRCCRNPDGFDNTCVEREPDVPRLWCGACHAREAWYAYQLECQVADFEELFAFTDGLADGDEPTVGGYPTWVYDSLMYGLNLGGEPYRAN